MIFSRNVSKKDCCGSAGLTVSGAVAFCSSVRCAGGCRGGVDGGCRGGVDVGLVVCSLFRVVPFMCGNLQDSLKHARFLIEFRQIVG